MSSNLNHFQRGSLSALLLGGAILSSAQNVTIRAVNQPADVVFRSMMEQTGKNFIYSSDILKDFKVTVSADNKPFRKVLDDMFRNTPIIYQVKGRNVLLKRNKKASALPKSPQKQKVFISIPDTLPPVRMLDEVTVVSRLEAPAVVTSEIGARKITGDEVRSTPTLLGEPDVIKAIHTQPGVIEGTEGLAGMYVHGGNADENLYMLDNIPLYQVNHFAGLFSAFNTDIIRYIDFFKSSMPAKYEGRLSSFMDVRLKNGSSEGHHGSARLGLTSGAFNISGPIGRKTTYLLGLRRSWYDVLTIPVLAILNSKLDEKVRLHYYFMDFNGKVKHRFSDQLSGFLNIYFGDDMLRTGTKETAPYSDYTYPLEDDLYDYHWGNLVAQTGINWRLSPTISAEFSAAYTLYFSRLKHHNTLSFSSGAQESVTESLLKTKNNINDWIFRGDFDWNPRDNMRLRFGADYIRHSFLPAQMTRLSSTDNSRVEATDSSYAYDANEVNLYIEDEWKISDRFRINAGLHGSLFNIDGNTNLGLSPRLSLSYRISEDIAVKGAYSRTTQYIHQLSQSYLSLPTDQWIPITGGLKPEMADKIAFGAYWQSSDSNFAASLEGYYKWMRHLTDYSDEFYLRLPMERWDSRLVQGKGVAKGIDLKFEKLSGRFTGHIAYSLAWADRTFPDKNGGISFPARFDNRHTINLLINWNINNKVSVNASWTGHSGNRFTLLPQEWESPDFGGFGIYGGVPLKAPINNYQLPFYHRLDIGCNVRNSRGYWSFSLYNAYCHMNTIAVVRGYKFITEPGPEGFAYKTIPVFQKLKLLPLIPSISYTWEF